MQNEATQYNLHNTKRFGKMKRLNFYLIKKAISVTIHLKTSYSFVLNARNERKMSYALLQRKKSLIKNGL